MTRRADRKVGRMTEDGHTKSNLFKTKKSKSRTVKAKSKQALVSLPKIDTRSHNKFKKKTGLTDIVNFKEKPIKSALNMPTRAQEARSVLYKKSQSRGGGLTRRSQAQNARNQDQIARQKETAQKKGDQGQVGCETERLQPGEAGPARKGLPQDASTRPANQPAAGPAQAEGQEQKGGHAQASPEGQEPQKAAEIGGKGTVEVGTEGGRHARQRQGSARLPQVREGKEDEVFGKRPVEVLSGKREQLPADVQVDREERLVGECRHRRQWYIDQKRTWTRPTSSGRPRPEESTSAGACTTRSSRSS